MSRAADFARVSTSALSNWKKTAEAALAKNPSTWSTHQRRCVTFMDEVTKAEADFYVRGVATIVAAANRQTVTETRVDKDGKTSTVTREVPGDWHAMEKVLANRFPAEWGARQAIELTGEGGGPVRVVTMDDVWTEIGAYQRQKALGSTTVPAS
jgi:hypothetical protein